MTESYLLLAPFLILAVVALLGFVGCEFRHGQSNPSAQPGPTNLVAVPGDGRVDLSWDSYAGATEYHVKRTTTSGAYTDPPVTVLAPSTQYADTTVTNGTTYYYVVSAIVDSIETDNSAETPPVTPTAIPTEYFITAKTLGTPANTFNGYAGMEIRIGANALKVHALGRCIIAGNLAQHVVKIIDKTTLGDLASVTLDTSGGVGGQFLYKSLASIITLNANASYYVVSSEVAGGDHFYQDDTTVQTTSAASLVNSINGDGVSPWRPGLTPNQTFGPLDFQYSVVP
jgi:hypothetical protein